MNFPPFVFHAVDAANYIGKPIDVFLRQYCPLLQVYPVGGYQCFLRPDLESVAAATGEDFAVFGCFPPTGHCA